VRSIRRINAGRICRHLSLVATYPARPKRGTDETRARFSAWCSESNPLLRLVIRTIRCELPLGHCQNLRVKKSLLRRRSGPNKAACVGLPYDEIHDVCRQPKSRKHLYEERDGALFERIARVRYQSSARAVPAIKTPAMTMFKIKRGSKLLPIVVKPDNPRSRVKRELTSNQAIENVGAASTRVAVNQSSDRRILSARRPRQIFSRSFRDCRPCIVRLDGLRTAQRLVLWRRLDFQRLQPRRGHHCQ
jgi:hypothetical protein